MIENWTEIGFAGLAAGILWMTFKWMTNELNKKIDDLHQIIIKLIDAKNIMVDKFQQLNDEVTDQLNYIEAKIGNGRGSKQKRKSSVSAPKNDDHSLCQFMNSAMNVEFVYLILIGINNFMENFGD